MQLSAHTRDDLGAVPHAKRLELSKKRGTLVLLADSIAAILILLQ
jgi:hypothetical protein